MPRKLNASGRGQLYAAAILLTAILVAWFAYAPGMGGGKWFDDAANLDGLKDVHDASSARQFILSGRAGPTGRPLALATFIPQAYAWPDALEVFLRTNILIHLLNGALVTWFLYSLGLARGQTEDKAAPLAAASGAVWMLLPILASSSLFIVQRMTTLSAVFVLSGAIAYLYSRRHINRRPLLALAGMTAALGAGTAIGMLAKESAALLFVLVLVMEATLLDRPARLEGVHWKSWVVVALIVPALALLVHVASFLPYPQDVVLRRDYTGLERLMTEAGILWKYLYFGFLPNLPSLGPFHDDYPVQRELLELATFVPIAGWIAAILTAVLLQNRTPLFAFALSWFLLGHSLESTAVPLELYFEHRNYLPLIGPVYALVASVLALGLPWRRLAAVATTLYALVLAGVLYSVASLWGTPSIAVEMWYIYKPASIRAAEVLAEQMEKTGNPDVALKVFREVRERNPEAHHLDLQVLLISCQIDPALDHDAAIDTLDNSFRTTRFSHALVGLLWGLDYLKKTGQCSKLPSDAVERLSLSLLANPRFNLDHVQSNLYVFLSQAAIERGEAALGIQYARKALERYPMSQTLTAVIEVLERAGMIEDARQIIAEAQSRKPSHPIHAMLWANEAERLEAALLRSGELGAEELN